MPLFEKDKLTNKQASKLARWQAWGEKMSMLRQMHAQNEVKRQAKIKAENSIFWAIGGTK